MKRTTLYVLCLIGILHSFSAHAFPQLKFSIISRDECVFGDSDLIVRDFVKDYAAEHLDSQLLLEVRNMISKVILLKQTLVNLRDGDRKTDPFSRVFEDGLAFSLSQLPLGEYSIAICKIDSATTSSCDTIQVKSFEEMAKDHQEGGTPLVGENRLYYFNTFQITPSGLDFARVAKDKRRILNSMPLEMVDGALIIDLPKADREKCG
jgi:hypothetical protein